MDPDLIFLNNVPHEDIKKISIVIKSIFKIKENRENSYIPLIFKALGTGHFLFRFHPSYYKHLLLPTFTAIFGKTKQQTVAEMEADILSKSVERMFEEFSRDERGEFCGLCGVEPTNNFPVRHFNDLIRAKTPEQKMLLEFLWKRERVIWNFNWSDVADPFNLLDWIRELDEMEQRGKRDSRILKGIGEFSSIFALTEVVKGVAKKQSKKKISGFLVRALPVVGIDTLFSIIFGTMILYVYYKKTYYKFMGRRLCTVIALLRLRAAHE